MSGGQWDYIQYRFTDIIEDIKSLIDKNSKPKTERELKEDRWKDDEYYEKYSEEKFHYKYPDEVIEEFKKSLDIIKKAQIYIQRIDWLLSGDDGEETFLTRLKEDLDGMGKRRYYI